MESELPLNRTKRKDTGKVSKLPDSDSEDECGDGKIQACLPPILDPEEIQERKERPLINWSKAKIALIRLIRVSRLMKGARENKQLKNRMISEFSVVTKKRCEKILISPGNSKLQLFIYLISIIGIFELYWLSLVVILELYWDTYKVFSLIVLPLYTLEICLKFITMYWKDVELIDDITVISKTYLKYRFWVDFLSTFPFFLLHHNLVGLKMIRVLRFNFYLDSLLKMCEEIVEKLGVEYLKRLYPTVKKSTQFFMYLSYIAHLFACSWIWVSDMNPDPGVLLPPGEEISIGDEYIASIYTIATIFTSVGFGDLRWESNGELSFQLFRKCSSVKPPNFLQNLFSPNSCLTSFI